MNGWETLLVIGVITGLTFLTRVLPFWLFRRQDRPSILLTDLNKLLPPAVIAVLVVFCLKSIGIHDLHGSLNQLVCVGLVIGLHIWKRNNLLSIGLGTAVYMLLTALV
ncbi:MAG: branched-chain amino acid transporter AzlD [Clostridia bacterium]|nr:AzlD domain-containing protein [Eubacteriales bacterium]NCC48009.1 branched-chain amino acid transporter AzlD [Clostridia bacterium]